MPCYNILNLISIAVYSWYSKENLLCIKAVNWLTCLSIGINFCIYVCVYLYKHLQELLNMWRSCRDEICKVSWLLIWNCYSSIIAACCLEMFFHSRQCKGRIPTLVTYCTLGLMLKKQLLHWCAPDGNNNCMSCSRHDMVLKLESCIGWL